MIIVIEGMDNSGKTTLAEHLSQATGYSIQHSGGPPKFPGEINQRIAKFNALTNIIFDRHAAISQPIYRVCRGASNADGERVSVQLIDQFYATRPLLIYCDPLSRGLAGQRHNAEVDTPTRQAEIRDAYEQLLSMYRAWAIQFAHLTYRIGDDIGRILTMVQSLQNKA